MSIVNPGQSVTTGVVNAYAVIENTNESTSANNAYVDSLITKDITITKTCTLYAWVNCSGGNLSASEAIKCALLIDGTLVDESFHFQTTADANKAGNSISLSGKKSGLAAGTYTVKLQYKNGFADSTTAFIMGANTGRSTHNNLTIMAVVE